MSYRSFPPAVLLAALTATALITMPVSGQTRNDSKTAVSRKGTPPRTPWGDPDLKGTYSNTSANGRDITLPDGKQLFAGSSAGTGAAYEAK